MSLNAITSSCTGVGNCSLSLPGGHWLRALSSLVCSSFVPHPLHLHLSPLYEVLDHTNQIFSVRIWSWQRVIIIISSYDDHHIIIWWSSYHHTTHDICYIFEKKRTQGYQIWLLCIISASSVHLPCIISVSSVHKLQIMSASSAHHKCIISAS